jgi:beta-mannan synthase
MVESEPKIFIPESFQVNYDVSSQIKMIWEVMKAPLIVPLLNACVYISLAMALMLFMERVYMGIVIVLIKLFWKKPEQRYNYEPLQDDEELGGSNFPVVLVQIPMFNEREVRQDSFLCFFSLFLFSSLLLFFFLPFITSKIPVHSNYSCFYLRQVYKVSIGAACGLSWPTDRLVIQVLDDSTDPVVKVFHKFMFIFSV